VDDFETSPRASRAHAINLALHTGTIMAFPGRAVLAVSSLALALLAVTGFVLWSKKIVA
jgi:uncharacterized iron-regulated membrane protein